MSPNSKKWERGVQIGAGAYGVVYLARLLAGHPLLLADPSLQVMAVKSAKNSTSSSLRHEQRLLKKLRGCPHIIRCFGYDFTLEEGEIFRNMFMEYASGGSLHDMIISAAYRGCRISEIEAREYTESVLLGLRFIHSHGYVHCDIKPDNILIVDGKAKIGDFGLAIKAGRYPGKINGTRNYLPPESTLMGEYESSADIWGLGCTLFEMITGEKQWRLRSKIDIHQIVERSGMSKKTLSFLRKCLIDDPVLRWDADMLLRHHFITGNVGNESGAACLPSSRCSSF